MMEILVLVLVLAQIIWHRKLVNRVNRLEDEVKLLRERPSLTPMDATANAAAGDALPASEPADVATGTEPVSPVPDVVEAAAREISEEEASAPSAQPVPRRESFESLFGARWAVWVGGLALALGGIFLVRYSIESGLLGPEARLVLAALFGLALAGAGEVLRRGLMPRLPETYSGAMIPGVLTAAASVTLLATIYAAHGFYGFIGSAPAFGLLALVSLGTLCLSLLYGQALAGLGLAGSLVTPLLVASTSPNVPVLFGFLPLVWLASNAAARLRSWKAVSVFSNIGLGLWCVAYTFSAEVIDPVAPAFALLVMIAGTHFIWPGAPFEALAAGKIGPERPGRIRHLLRIVNPAPRAIMASVSLSVSLPTLLLLTVDTPAYSSPSLVFVAVTGALAALGSGRIYAGLAALTASVTALLGALLLASTDISDISPISAPQAKPAGRILGMLTPDSLALMVLGAIFTFCGLMLIQRRYRTAPDFAAFWAVLAGAVPIALATISFLSEGIYARDWAHGAYGLLLFSALLFGAVRILRSADDDLSRGFLLLGSFGASTFALHALTNGLATTVLVPLLGFAYVLSVNRRPWRSLPWIMVAAGCVVLARIGWEPSIVGPDRLGKTPVFNALLPGYGIPALLLGLSAWHLRHWSGTRVLNALQGLAALMALMTVAILVRHGMHGGTLDAGAPTLGEQSIYTLITVGFSGILMALDLKGPSFTFRFGSMLAGIIATINVLSLHIFTLNPYFSGETVGALPFINLLLPGYLLPALAYAGLAFYARGKRPQPYVIMLALTAALLGFLWVTLTVRWAWQGANIADWKGFLGGETYSYSVVWLIIGVALLAVGSKLDARSLRLASAGLVVLTVLKVFLIDMANLEGILRALSFMGLGGVLIGIGLFYQRILVQKNGAHSAADSKDASDVR